MSEETSTSTTTASETVVIHDAPLETERLILRPITLADAAFYLRLMNSPGWLKYIGDRHVYTLPESETYLAERVLPQWTRLGYGNYIAFRKSDDEPIGAIGIFSRPGLDTVDLGFALLDDFTRQGYAFEGAHRLLTESFATFGLSKIQAITDPENIPCQQLLTKLGFQFVENLVLPNETRHVLVYVYTKP